MYGAILGDIIGSVYEASNIKKKSFELLTDRNRFTDDSVLTIATMEKLLTDKDYSDVYREFAKLYPRRGYGGRFRIWVKDSTMGPYNSFGNGSAMRVSPIAWYYDDMDMIMSEAKKSAEVTHNHPEGIKGAQATALAIFLARTGSDKEIIKDEIISRFAYDLNDTIDNIRPNYSFDSSCQGSVPQAIIAFLESDNFEDAIRNAISIGGDSDTIACITGSIAEAYYGIDEHLINEAKKYLDEFLISKVESFYKLYVDR